MEMNTIVEQLPFYSKVLCHIYFLLEILLEHSSLTKEYILQQMLLSENFGVSARTKQWPLLPSFYVL